MVAPTENIHKYKRENNMKKTEETNHWNPETYNRYTSFVSSLALPVVALLEVKEGESILDVGCGEGTLAVEIAKYGAKVVGVDMSQEMVTMAQKKGVDAYVGSVTRLDDTKKYDKVFSNATLHWVKDAKGALANIAKVLYDGGTFVAEFGGYGNVAHIIKAIEKTFDKHPEFGVFENPWYFPSVVEYKSLLEEVGFRVVYIESIPRPTPMDDIANWIDVFTRGITKDLSEKEFKIFKKEVVGFLKETNYTLKDGWVADYVRLRVKAVKV